MTFIVSYIQSLYSVGHRIVVVDLLRAFVLLKLMGVGILSYYFLPCVTVTDSKLCSHRTETLVVATIKAST